MAIALTMVTEIFELYFIAILFNIYTALYISSSLLSPVTWLENRTVFKIIA
jgi:hypothetical protein